jgi:hypothetical protein
VDDQIPDQIPDRIARLPKNKAGYPIPWFVGYVDGEPDFRVIRAGGIRDAVQFGRCWVCGQPRGSYAAFTIGPMCAVNRISAEPPAHRDCAIYSATHCPFLTTPNMVRRERHIPEGATNPAGVMIKRNPGVALVWISKRWKMGRVGDGVLFDVGDPHATHWYAHGREATRAEVLASIDSGLPALRAVAEKDGPLAVAELESMTLRAMALLPPEAAVLHEAVARGGGHG